MSRAVSARWKETVKGVVNWKTRVDWSNDGGHSWLAAPSFFSGSVTCDSTSQVRWTTSDLTIGGVPLNQDAVKTEDGISPFRTRFRIRHGIEYSPGVEELIGMGVYRCSGVHESTTQPDGLVLTGQSFESYFIKPLGSFPKPRHFPEGTVRMKTEQIIHDILPDAAVIWLPGVDPDTRVPAFIGEDDRWLVLSGATTDPSIVRSIGGQIWCGGDGEWLIGPPGSLGDDPSFTSEAKVNQFSADNDLSSEGVYNVISVQGQGTDGTATLGPVIVLDDDPESPTYARLTPDQGGFGVSVRYYVSDKFTNTNQMGKTGQSFLAQTLGLRQQVTFSRAYDPSIEPGDVGLVDTPRVPMKAIVDSIGYDLSGNSPMDGQARTTSSRYSGQVGTWDDATDGGLGDA